MQEYEKTIWTNNEGITFSTNKRFLDIGVQPTFRKFCTLRNVKNMQDSMQHRDERSHHQNTCKPLLEVAL